MTPQERGSLPPKDARYERGRSDHKGGRFACPACGGKLRPLAGNTVIHYLGVRSRVCWRHRRSA